MYRNTVRYTCVEKGYMMSYMTYVIGANFVIYAA